MRKLFVLVIFFIITMAENSYAQVVDTDRGKVEFVGLNSWTVDALVDTLKSISPNQSLHACAADLRFKLGFADASAIGYFDNGELYTVITVVEPRDKIYIQYLEEPSDSLEAISEWRKAIELIAKDFRGFNIAIQNYGRVLFNDKQTALDNLPDWVNIENVEEIWEFLLNHNNVDDFHYALWVLNSDKNYLNRMVASSILANFSEYDLTWWILFDNMRYPDARVSGTSMAVIHNISQYTPRSVNWAPAKHSVQHVLRGTNLFAYNTALNILSKTGLNKELAEVLIRDKQIQKLLRAYLGAEFKSLVEYGQGFLSILDENMEEVDNWQQILDSYINGKY